MSFTGKEKVSAFTIANFNGANYMVISAQPGWFALEGIDLTGVGAINLMAGWLSAPQVGIDFEVRLDKEDGKSIGKASLLPPSDKKAQGGMIHINLSPVSDAVLHRIYILAKRREKETATVGLTNVQFAVK